MNIEIQKLVEVSHKIGAYQDLIQGGGGNISAKGKNGIMYIKASGTHPKDMTTKKGFVAVNGFGDMVDSFQGQRPSIEVKMHLHLAQYVVHTHPVNVNIFTCMEGGRRYLDHLFSKHKPLYISYKNPGDELAEEIKIKTELYKKKHSKNPEIIFLENHGLVTCSKNADRAVGWTFYINDTIHKYLHSTLSNFEEFNTTKLSLGRAEGYLFPDMAVFSSAPLTSLTKEIFAAHEYVLFTIKKLGANPRYLTETDVSFIKSMESEKYRIGVAMGN